MRKWRIAFLAGLDYARMPAGEVIDSLKNVGYEGIEWTTAHFDPNRPLSELKELVGRTHDAGMAVSRIMAHEDLVSPDEEVRKKRIDRTVRIIDAAGACGVATVGTMTGPAPWDTAAPRVGKEISESEAWEQVLEAYEILGKAAEEAGVVISSEGVFGMVAHDFYTHRFLIEALDNPVQKVNLDPSHGILYGNHDVAWVARQWGDRIAHVHLKDAVGDRPEPGKFIFPLLGEGQVNWTAFFGALAEIGYAGFCSVEFESFDYYRQVLKGDPEAAARLSLQQVEALLSDQA